MKKYRFNKDKFFRNFVILSNVITIGLVIHKIVTCGISFMSTIRIFWIERRKRNVFKYSYKTRRRALQTKK